MPQDWITFTNLNGSDIFLKIRKNGVRSFVEIQLKYNSGNWIKKGTIVLSQLIVLCVLSWYFGVVDFVYALLGVVLSFLAVIKLWYSIESENIIVVAGLGLQVTITHNFGIQKATFYPWDCIKDIFINEVISRHRVIYILTAMIERDSSEKLTPLFTNMQPRLKCLELMYREIQEIFR